MLDINLLRNDLARGRGGARQARRHARHRALRRAREPSARRIQTRTQELQAKRNALSKQIGIAKGKGEDASRAAGRSRRHSATSCKRLEAELDARAGASCATSCSTCRTSRTRATPVGKSADDNVEVRRWGTPRAFDFPVKDHVDLGEGARACSTSRPRRSSPARASTFLRGDLARLHRALAQFMLDMHTREHGYTECYTPYIVNARRRWSARRSCRSSKPTCSRCKRAAPKGEGERLYLISTVGDHADQPRARRDPRRPTRCRSSSTAHTPCFRSEAGSYGKDTRGMIRQHQFDKVELVQIVHPGALVRGARGADRPRRDDPAAPRAAVSRGGAVHRRHRLRGGEDLRPRSVAAGAERVSRDLVVLNCEAFQARRMQARFRNAQGKPELVHTLNGSGLAVGRTLVAVLENYQRADGSIEVPAALRPYMGGRDHRGERRGVRSEARARSRACKRVQSSAAKPAFESGDRPTLRATTCLAHVARVPERIASGLRPHGEPVRLLARPGCS